MVLLPGGEGLPLCVLLICVFVLFVLMEYSLTTSVWQSKTKHVRLNPCSNGMLSDLIMAKPTIDMKGS